MNNLALEVAVDSLVETMRRDGHTSQHIASILHAQADRIYADAEAVPLSNAALAERMARSRWYIWSMKKAGYRFTHGRRTTLASALQWLKEHPDFKTS